MFQRVEKNIQSQIECLRFIVSYDTDIYGYVKTLRKSNNTM